MSKQLTQKSIAPVKEQMRKLGLPVEVIEKEASFALQLINRSKDLSECTQNSILAAIVNVANIGLSLNPANNECAIVARWNGKLRQKEASLEPMYQGLIRLAMREGVVKQMVAQIVYEKDNFEVDLGSNSKPVTHTFNQLGDRGAIIGVYALATYENGYQQVEVMNLEEIHTIRDMSDGYKAFVAKKIKSHPWANHFGEMARKTVIKRICKYLNRKGNESKLNEAIELSNQDYGAKDWQKKRIAYLLETSTYDHETRAIIERDLDQLTVEEATQVLIDLDMHQLPNHPAYNDRVGKKVIGQQVAAQVANKKA